MRVVQIGFLLVFALMVSACGKNEAIRSVPLQPLPQAPPPPGYAPGGTPGYGYPGYPGGTPAPQYPNPYFQPQIPQGYGQGYYPFLPVDNYMRQNPYRQQYWTQFWGQWQQYAYYNNYQQYDFNRFWFEYCPQQWGGTEWASMYNWYDSNVYGWATPNTYYAPKADPGYFWQNYNGFSYYPLDQQGYCYDDCW